MDLVVNGKNVSFTGETLGDLIKQLDINIDSVIAEINGEIVFRDQFATRKIEEKDKIEIVRFVGGG